MNNLSSLVVSRKLAQKLKEAGYPQESIFVYYPTGGSEYRIGTWNEPVPPNTFPEYGIISAPIASEIELLMPRLGDRSDLSIDIWTDTTGYEFSIEKEVKMRCGTEEELIKCFEVDSLVEGYAKCYLYLKNNNLLSK